MSIITRTTLSTGDIPTAAEWNTQFDTAYNVINGNLDSTNLAANAVTTSEITDSNVTTAKIADLNVTTAKINTDAVTTVKILDDNVTTAKILDANVTTAKIADSNVTLAKMASDTLPVFESKALSSDLTSDQTMSDMTFTVTSGASYLVTCQVFFDIDITLGDGGATVSVMDGATVIGVMTHQHTTGSHRRSDILSSTYLVEMAGTSLTFVASSLSASANINGDGTKDQTFATVMSMPLASEGTVS